MDELVFLEVLEELKIAEYNNAGRVAQGFRHIRNPVDELNNEEFQPFLTPKMQLGSSIISRFYRKYNMPGVIGCIDCTHLAIFPHIQDSLHPEHLYVNRKQYHSINVQLICDSNLKILNVNARYPGSTHDSFIWANSNVQGELRNLHRHGYNNYFLLETASKIINVCVVLHNLCIEHNLPEVHLGNDEGDDALIDMEIDLGMYEDAGNGNAELEED
ncbi:hypothetical protein NQ314_021411 [Rhamnusium bicolor]|uniref:DDE Tnp4 domain-containing protein n=1 Tax=Rhamnusium bicolor TaxID=1586634 RepID=A0AAV8WIN3_9CUCU|nr:hypothetical protein NQ314_021411 [Rhamnusium bicolor]